MRFMTLSSLAALSLALASSGDAQSKPCCTVVSIDARAGLISAKVTASGQTFQFKVASPLMTRTLRVGQAVYANFSTNQVSLDGRTQCCAITQAPRGGLAVRPPIREQAPAAGPSAGATAIASQALLNLPQVTYGEPIVVERRPKQYQGKAVARAETQRVIARVGGRERANDVMLIRGLDGIEKAPGLNENARKLLKMHVKTLRPGESNSYIVSPGAAEEWMTKHPLPANFVTSPMDCGSPFVNRAAYDICMQHYALWKAQNGGGGGGSDCGNMFESVNCFEETVQQIGEGFTEGWEAMWEAANKTWDHWTGEMQNAWDVASGCFVERQLPGPTTPVKFSITPSMPLDVEKGNSSGGASGTVKGSVRLGVPLEADLQAKATFFYIPCLPFVVRPRSLTADGQITVGQQLEVAVEATGSFKKTLTIPPSGGPQIPIVVIPIVIGGVPVAVLDVSAYIEGEVDLESRGKATGQFTLTNSHRSVFDFTCDGGGCKGTEKGKTAPAQSNESVQIEGQVSVRPGLFTAVQLGLNYNVLVARAGPQPFLLGVASGCTAISASQTAGETTSTDQNSALTADLDWGVKLRAEALAGGQRIGKRWETEVVRSTDNHLWFKDLATGGSSALQPAVAVPPTAVAGQRTDFKVRMPTCYPYPEKVQYQITWTGNATPAGAACTWQAGTGICWFDPARDLPFSLTWPNAGTYTVSVLLKQDEHRKSFGSTRRAQHNVAVGAGGGL